MIPIMEGTKYVHAHGFLHRDIAPDNIYLTEEGMPLLIDFGAARDAIAQQSKNISSVVKEGYSSPEQYTVNNQQNASADIYAIGAVLYRMITGKVPPSAPQRQSLVLNDQPDPIQSFPTEYAKGYTPILLHAVAKAMNLRASDRFESVAALEEALTQHVVVDATPAPRSSSYTPSQVSIHNVSETKSRTGLWIFAGLVIVAIAGTGYLATHKEAINNITALVSPSSPSESKAKKARLEKIANEIERVKAKRQEEEAQKQKAIEAVLAQRKTEEETREKETARKATQRAEEEKRQIEARVRAEYEARRKAEEAKLKKEAELKALQDQIDRQKAEAEKLTRKEEYKNTKEKNTKMLPARPADSDLSTFISAFVHSANTGHPPSDAASYYVSSFTTLSHKVI